MFRLFNKQTSSFGAKSNTILLAIAILLLIIYGIFVFVGEKEKLPDATKVVGSIQNISELAVVRYDVKKIIKYKDESWWGTRSILFEVKASLKAGANLQTITEKDIEISGKTITIFLPPPQVLSVSIQPDDINEVYRSVTGFKTDFDNREKDKILQQGEQHIRQKANEMDILKDAELYLKQFFDAFLKEMGFETVVVQTKNPVKP